MATSTLDVTFWDETNAGSAVHLDGASLPATRSIVVGGGSDGSNIRAFRTNSSGQLVLASTSATGMNARDGSGNAIDSRLYDSTGNTIFSNHRGLDIVRRRMPLVPTLHLNNANPPSGTQTAGYGYIKEAERTTTGTGKINILDAGGAADGISQADQIFILGFSVNRCTPGSTIGGIVTLEWTQFGSTVIAKAVIGTVAGIDASKVEVWFPVAIQATIVDTFNPAAVALAVKASGATSTVWQGRLIYEVVKVGG